MFLHRQTITSKSILSSNGIEELSVLLCQNLVSWSGIISGKMGPGEARARGGGPTSSLNLASKGPHRHPGRGFQKEEHRGGGAQHQEQTGEGGGREADPAQGDSTSLFGVPGVELERGGEVHGEALPSVSIPIREKSIEGGHREREETGRERGFFKRGSTGGGERGLRAALTQLWTWRAAWRSF